jgi:hypothetical protein
MRTLFCISVLFATGFLGPQSLHAQNPQIKKVIEKAGLKYTVDKDGDFKLVFSVEEGRTQVVFISSATEEMGGETIVEIWSPAYKNSAITSETLALLLKDSGQKKIGAWEVISSDTQVFALFKAKVPMSALSPAFLQTVCEGVVTTADAMEKSLLGSDDF